MQAILLALCGLALGCASGGFAGTESTPAFQIDPNTAPPGVLASLPRLGPTRVAALLEARDERPFDSPADLEHRVKGIGPATLAVSRPYLRFEP